MSEQHPLQPMKDMYDKLCAQRDEAYARAAPLEAELDKVNADMEQLRLRGEALAKEIENAWGPGHVALKKQIGALAKALGAVNGVLATRE